MLPSFSVKSVHTYQARRRHTAEEEYVIVNIRCTWRLQIPTVRNEVCCLLSAGTGIARGTSWMSENEAGELFAPPFDIAREKNRYCFLRSFFLVCLASSPPIPLFGISVELCRLRYWLHWCRLRYWPHWCRLRYWPHWCRLRYWLHWCRLRYWLHWCRLRYWLHWCRLRYWLHWRELSADETTTALKQCHMNFVAEFINTSHFPQNDKEKLNKLLILQLAVFSAAFTSRKH